VEEWQNETTKSFQLVSRPGGHRYIEHEATFVTATILDAIGDEEAVFVNQPS